MANDLYFEDLHPGMKFPSARSYKVTAEEIKEFAERYDPQPFHLDEAAGESSFFKGLAASGWLTAAIVMRLRVESFNIAGGRRDPLDAARPTRGHTAYRSRNPEHAFFQLTAGVRRGPFPDHDVQPA